jgi:thioredoxin-related protein
MKSSFLLSLLFIVSINALAQKPVPSAEQVLKQAYGQAAKENKNLMVIFHASWCGWCHKMDTSLNDPSVKKFFDDNYVITHLTVLESPGKKNLENPGAEALLEKHRGKDQGIPFWLVFDGKGKLLADALIPSAANTPDAKPKNSGCPATAEEVEHFIQVLRKTSRMNETQLDAVRKRFRQNEN